MTPWEEHVEKWSNCSLCPLCEKRTRIVLARGSLPCDIAFIGEAPGVSEDVRGLPFHGPAGHLLDQIVRKSGASKYRLLFLNLLGCIPYDENMNKVGEPPRESVKACAPRVVELVRIGKPRIIVLVGAHAQRYVSGQSQFALNGRTELEWIPPGKFLEFVSIEHPASILRQHLASQGLRKERAAVAISSTIEDVFNVA
jgi:DNA polymerase